MTTGFGILKVIGEFHKSSFGVVIMTETPLDWVNEKMGGGVRKKKLPLYTTLSKIFHVKH